MSEQMKIEDFLSEVEAMFEDSSLGAGHPALFDIREAYEKQIAGYVLALLRKRLSKKSKVTLPDAVSPKDETVVFRRDEDDLEDYIKEWGPL